MRFPETESNQGSETREERTEYVARFLGICGADLVHANKEDDEAGGEKEDADPIESLEFFILDLPPTWSISCHMSVIISTTRVFDKFHTYVGGW